MLTMQRACQIWAGSFTGEESRISPEDGAFLEEMYRTRYDMPLIAELSLSFRRLVRARAGEMGNRAKVYTTAPDAVTGVRHGNDLPNLSLPGWAALATPATRGLFALNYAQRTLPMLERKGVTAHPINPLVLVMDTSASMSSNFRPVGVFEGHQVLRSTMAQAIGLLMVSMGRAMKRPVYVINFQTQATVTACVSIQSTWAALNPYFRGGTRIIPPITLLINGAEAGWGWHGGDIVFLTDGEADDYTPPPWKADLPPARRGEYVTDGLDKQWRRSATEHRLRTLGVVISDASDKEARENVESMMAAITDSTVTVEKLVNAQMRKVWTFLAEAML